MATQGKSSKHVSSSPLLVSTHCSGLKSLYRTCRRQFSCSELSDHHLLNDPISRRSMTVEGQTAQKKFTSLPSPMTRTRSHDDCIKNRRVVAKMYWERAQQLETELTELDNWLSTEKKLRDGLNNCGRKNEVCAKSELMKLTHGGYLHYINVATLGRPYRKNLVMQVSEPAMLLVEAGSSIPQVLNRMALMGRENLIQWLLESMAMNDDILGTKIGARPIEQCSEEGFLEAVFLNAVENLKTLVLEGMEVQTGGRGKVKTEETWKKKLNEDRVGDCITEVMLVQIRDPNKEFEAVGEMMIGLVETSITCREERGFLIKGVHVAGISTKTSDQTGKKEYLWSISMRSSCEKFVRNVEIYLPSSMTMKAL